MRNNGRPAPQRRKQFIINDYRQPLPTAAEVMPGGKYPPQLMFEQANNGKIILKVNDGVFKEGGKNTHKEVEMDWGDRNFLFEALLEATNNPDFGMRKVTPRKKQFIQGPGGGKMSDSPIAQVNLVITRQEDGIITLGWSKGDYKVVFIFKAIRDLVVMMRGPDGQPKEDHGIMSRCTVRCWVNFHRPVLDELERNSWEPPKPREGAPSYNNNRPPQQNSGASNDDFDNDPDF